MKGRQMPHTGLRRSLQRSQAGSVQIIAQDADRRGTDHVAGTGDRKGGNRQTAGQRFQQNQGVKVSVLLGKYEESARG